MTEEEGKAYLKPHKRGCMTFSCAFGLCYICSLLIIVSFICYVNVDPNWDQTHYTGRYSIVYYDVTTKL